MDYLTNFSLKYTESEGDTFCSDELIPNGTFDCETSPQNSITILSPMLFSRQSSLDSLSTTSWDGYAVESDYSHYISSSVSPSEIPDSPSSETMPHRLKRGTQADGSSVNDADERDNNLIESLVSLAFAGSIGMTLIILACALPQYQLWWPFFVVLFYVFSIFPTLLAKRSMNNSLSGSSPCLELAIFLTMGFVISSYALPIVLARAGVIMWGACYLTICGNFVVYGTIVGYFLLFDSEDNVYGGMA